MIRLRGVHQFAIAALVLAMPVASPAAVCLNGTDAYVQIGGDLPSYDSFTIELRALWDGSPPVPTDENSQASLFYEGSSGEVAVGYALLDGALFLRCSLKLEDDHWYGVPPVSLEPLCDGDVHHLAAVRDFGAGTLQLYVDGVMVSGTRLPMLQGHVSAYGTAIGRFGIWNREYASALVAEVRVWNRALSAGEITDRMWTPLTGDEAGLIGYWPLDEGSGTTAFDRSPFGNNGTLQGGTIWCEYDTPSPVRRISWGAIKAGSARSW